MDKESGDKDTAFTWAMGELILARIAERETMRAITAHRAMPAYCTVFRWMQVVPEFGDAVRRLRADMARARLAARDAAKRAARRRCKDGAPWRGGQRPRVSAEALGRVLQALLDGASMTEALRAPGAPSAKAVYTRVRGCPGFRLAFTEACDFRDFVLEQQRWDVVNRVGMTGIPAANATLRALEGRRGRLRPKLYRLGPPGTASPRGGEDGD